MRPDENERTEAFPPMGRGPGNGGDYRSGAGGMSAGGRSPLFPEDTDPFATRDLPPGLFPSYNVRKPPKPPKPPRSRAPWIAAGSVLVVIAVALGVLYTSSRVAPHSGLGGILSGCGDNTPCGVAQNYTSDFSGGKYEAMYGLTSNASRQRFSSPKILSGPGFSYKDAHDYIVTRTSSFMDVAQVTNVSASVGAIHQTSGTAASAPMRVIYTSSIFGTIIENVTLPLVSEGGQWKVDWSPGLVVAQLDDPSGDPNYQRHVIANITIGNRGAIYDDCTSSCGATDILAQDAPVWQILAATAKVSSENSMAQAVGTALGISAGQISANYETRWNCGPSGERLVATLTQQPTSAQQSALGAIAGVTVNATTGRVYPYGADLAAVTGHIARITGDQLNADKSNYYNQCSMIGDTGVEAWGEQYLRPGQGGTLEIRNRSDGALYYTIATRAAANGDDIHTTINLADQRAAVAALKATPNGKGRGTFAVDPTTGEVLVMASLPACDPSAFAQENFFVYLGCLNDSTNQPLNNYATQSQVPTGSVFKIVTLSAALENGVKPTDIFTENGSYQVPGQPSPYIDPNANCKGGITAPNALGPSCDAIYMMIGVQVNGNDHTIMQKMARAYGLGSSPDILGLPDGEQAAGLVPDPTYYQQQNIGTWAPVDDANLAIGQGDFEASPAQITMITQAVANNGTRLQPRLVTSITNGGATVQTFAATTVGTLPISADHLAIIQQAMEGVTAKATGTEYPTFKNFSVLVAGKSGTAQACETCTNSSHTWSTNYAPASPPNGPPVTPKVATTTLILYASKFNGSSATGDSRAAPINKALIAQVMNVPNA